MIRQLVTPETVAVPGGTLTATHEAFQTEHYAHENRAIVRRRLGVLDTDGNFETLAIEAVTIEDTFKADGTPKHTDYSDMLAADAATGKRAGLVRSDDFEAAFAAIRARS